MKWSKAGLEIFLFTVQVCFFSFKIAQVGVFAYASWFIVFLPTWVYIACWFFMLALLGLLGTLRGDFKDIFDKVNHLTK